MKHAKHILLMAAMLLGCFSVSAEVVQIDGIWYDVVKKAKQAEVVSNPDGTTKYSGNITIPSIVEYDGVECSVTSIVDRAFRGCESLTSITIPESVTSIGEWTFSGCSSLTAINIPEGVSYIYEGAFYGCSSLTAITLPLSVTSIRGHAFYECSSLTAINIPEGVTSIGEMAFYKCSSLKSITLPLSVTSIGNFAFTSCSSLTAITIPANVGYINEGAFCNCSSLTAITLPASVWTIGESAFERCSSLTAINFPENSQLTNIYNYAFSGCSSLTAINIPEGVGYIYEGAFSGCSSLTAITIPKSMSYISDYVFANCAELLDVYCYAESVLKAKSNTFNDSYPEYMTLHVPASALESYKTTAPWSSFGTIVALGASITDITLSQSSATLYEGEALTLSISVTPSNADMNLISWSSSNPNVATVDAEGKVAAVSTGTATITVTANDGSGVSASCEVTVVEAASYSLTFMVDGEIIQTETSETPIEVVFPEAPEKEGHNFLSWRMDVNDDEITEIDIANNADAMLYSNAPCTNTQYGDQFTSWDVLFDDDYNTFFHSEYSEGVDSEDGEHHYLRVDMGEGNSISKFTFSYAMRGDQFPFHTPTEIVVEGSNDADGVYEEIAVLTDLAAPPYEISYTSEILGNGKAYRYIRYRVTRTRQNSLICGHPYFYISEFGMKNADNLRKMVYRAYYECNAYNVYYYVGEELVNTVRVFYGDNIPEYTYEPTDNNKEFLGWEGDTYSTMPAHDVTYRAIINSDETGDSDTGYSLTFMVDGEVFQTETSETPIEMVFPEAPEKEGYSFVRWELGSSDAALTDIDIANNADEMLYTNAPCTNTKWGDQFTSWDVLFDDNYNTFFHSEYSEGVDSEDGEHHYLRVDMGEGNAVSQFTFSYAMRGDQYPDYTPTEIIVEGSNEVFGEYEVIAVLTDLVLPPSRPPYNKDYTSEILGNGNAYRYIRYRVTETYHNDLVCGHPYFYISEFGMKKAQDCYNAVYHGVYAPNKYKVYYYVGEELLDYVEVTYGDQMPNMGYFPALDTEEFLGWVSETGDTYETMPAHDVIYVANIRTYEKCATPTIRYADGRMTFSCETEGVEFTTQVIDDKRPIYRTDSEGFEFVPTYTFITYATKEDCIDSDDVSVTICWIDCTGEHEVGDDETDVISVPAQPVIIQCANGVITLTGLADGTAVVVYDTAGMEQGTAEVQNGVATIETNLTAGSTAIVTMGNRSVKVVIK